MALEVVRAPESRRSAASHVDVARQCLERYFGLRGVYQRTTEIALLEDGAGVSLGVSHLRGAPVYPTDFYVGFGCLGPGGIPVEVRAPRGGQSSAGWVASGDPACPTRTRTSRPPDTPVGPTAGAVRQYYRPVQCGVRLSRNAATPS
jgi:hypothetical protein